MTLASLERHPELLQELEGLMGPAVAVKLVFVLRNPYDVIATRSARNHRCGGGGNSALVQSGSEGERTAVCAAIVGEVLQMYDGRTAAGCFAE